MECQLCHKTAEIKESNGLIGTVICNNCIGGLNTIQLKDTD